MKKTSALKSVESEPKTARERVLDALKVSPKTDEEIEEATGLKHQTASARRNELVKENRVCDSGEVRKIGSRTATVWQVHRGVGCSCSPYSYDEQVEAHLGEAQLKVYRALKRSAMTGAEIDAALSTTSAHKRISELEALGVVAAGAERPCRRTGKVVREWRVVERASLKLPPRSPTELPVPSPLTVAPLRPTNEELKEAADELWRLGLAALTAAKFPTVLSALKKKGLRPEDLAIGDALRKTVLWVRLESGEEVQNVVDFRERNDL